MPRPRRTIVADDLTGASDAGVQFAKSGLRTTVWLDHTTALDTVDADVVVFDMDSRAIAPDAAYARMRHLLSQLSLRTPRQIVQKMDSTLRGNVGLELRALLEVLPGAFALVCPAYPKNERTSRNGIAMVHGVPVDQTDFGRDPFSPVHDARIAARLEGESILLDLATVRAGTAVLAAAIGHARECGIRIAIADAETDDDLRTIAELGTVSGDLLWVCSAGLLEMLAHATVKKATPQQTIPPANGPVVFLIGSLSTMTQRQVADFADHDAGVVERLDPLALLSGEPQIAGAIVRAATALATGRNVLITLSGDRHRVEDALHDGGRQGWDVALTSRRIREAFVRAADPLIAGRPGATVVLSGGDIARTFCDAHAIRGMTLLAEAAPGIPISRAIGADLQLVTKAGGFGRPETFRDVLHCVAPYDSDAVRHNG